MLNRIKLLLTPFLPYLSVFFLLLGALLWSQAHLQPLQKDGAVTQTPSVGATLADFHWTTLDGKTSTFSDHPRKLTLLNFWASWCDACMEEMPSLVRLREAYASQGFEIIGVNLDENPLEIIPQIQKKFQIPFPLVADSQSTLVQLFAVYAIPMTLVLDQNRKVLLQIDGEKDWNSPWMHHQMDAWLK